MTGRHILALSGYALSGKDTIADILVDQFGYRKTYMSKPLEEALLALDPPIPMRNRDLNRMILEVRDADSIYEAGNVITYKELHAFVGYADSKKELWVRKLLQNLGTEVGRNLFGENIWIDKVISEVLDEDWSSSNWVVTGIRYPNELAAFRSIEADSAWVSRPGIDPVNTHSSDNSLSALDCDFVVPNAGTIEDLEWVTKELHKRLVYLNNPETTQMEL